LGGEKRAHAILIRHLKKKKRIVGGGKKREACVRKTKAKTVVKRLRRGWGQCKFEFAEFVSERTTALGKGVPPDCQYTIKS